MMVDQAQNSPADDALELGARLLRTQADQLGLEFQDKPAYASQIFAGGSNTPSARLEPSDLPQQVRGIQIGRYALILSLLPEAPDEKGVNEVVRRLRNQCVVARSYLSPAAALDLHAILVGPRGSEGVDRWKALALIAERDERVARKLVWLRPHESIADAQSFADFTRRSFLARPWVTNAVFSMAPLDNVGRAAASDIVPRDTAGEWARLVGENNGDPDALVDSLVDTWSRRTLS
jgi:hypothetical protein